MSYFIHIHGKEDKEFTDNYEAFKSLAKVLQELGYTKEDIDFQCREDKEFTAPDGETKILKTLIEVSGSGL